MEEVFEKNGEMHYVWPQRFRNGFTTRCEQCYYYVASDQKGVYWDGECSSICQNKDHGYIHRKDGNDYVRGSDTACRWYYQKDDYNTITASLVSS